MNKKKLVLAVQSVLCILLAVMLAAAAAGICREGLALRAADPLSPVYTRENAAAALIPVLPLMAISLVATAAGLRMGFCDGNADRPVRDAWYLRDLAAARTASPSDQMIRERTLQKKLFRGGWAFFAIAMVPVLCYLADGDHFPGGDLEPVFISLAGHVLPWTALGMAGRMIASVLEEKSVLRETEAAKEQIRLEKAVGIRPEKAQGIRPERAGEAEKKYSGPQVLRMVLLLLAAALIFAGMSNGSARDVFGKAVKICTECIGLG